jgi:hypothetical protein
VRESWIDRATVAATLAARELLPVNPISDLQLFGGALNRAAEIGRPMQECP